MAYYFVESGRLHSAQRPPDSAVRLAAAATQLQPPLVTALHQSLRAWGDAGLSPGPISAGSVWLQSDRTLGVEHEHAPKPLMHVALAPDLAAWLVLLDKSMETFVVIARARAVWSVEELGGALGFMTPAYLPPELVRQAPDNWTRVAHALAVAIADGPLRGAPTDQR